jgi:hypothetical protein
MWTAFLAGLVLAAQTAAAPNPTGTIAGRVVSPQGTRLSRPAQILLLPPEYTETWNTDVQVRLDNYWEDYKPTFIQQKEMFYEIEKKAYRDAFEFVVKQIRRHNPMRSVELIQDSTADGAFEFRNASTGRYRVLALGRIGDQDVVWSESVELKSPAPMYIQLKKIIP